MRAARSAAVAAVTALALAGCSGSGAPAKTASTTAPSASVSARAGTPVDPAALGRRVRAAVAGVRSAHLRLDITLAGQAVTGGGEEKLTAGRLDALRVTESVASLGDITVVVVGDTTYARLPATLVKSRKPWVTVSSESTNPVVRQLASTIDIAKAAASLSSTSDFVSAATTLNRVGAGPAGGVRTTDYSMVVAPGRLPADFPGRADLVATGLIAVPVQLSLDARSRPVRVAITTTISGQPVDTTLGLSRFDEPVTITAPAADQVGSG